MPTNKIETTGVNPFIELFLVFWLLSTAPLLAQEVAQAPDGNTASTADLAQAAANPIANMISLPFQFNFNFNQGPFDRYGTVLNLQPVLPFKLTKKWNVVTRTIIPILQIPDVYSTSGSTSGLGNINFNTFFVPPAAGIFTYGFGVSMIIPTATAPELGGDAFGIGPTVVALVMPKPWVIGFTAGYTFAYKSPDGSDALSSFFGQYFITYNLKNGWNISTGPTITGNFNAPEGEQWVVPVGAGVGKLMNFKRIKAPIKFSLQYYYNVVQASQTPGTEIIDLAHNPLQPMGNANQSLVFYITFLFPR
jgi:hypothetical protein